MARARASAASAGLGGELSLRIRVTIAVTCGLSARPLPVTELRRLAAADPFPARVIDGTELAKFASGATPVTDADGLPAQTPQATDW